MGVWHARIKQICEQKKNPGKSTINIKRNNNQVQLKQTKLKTNNTYIIKKKNK